MKIINLYLLIINITSFITMGIDKFKAIKNKRRISEHTLITLSAFGGSIGTLLAMLIFRHKIRKPKFILLIPTFIVILILIYKKIPLN